MRVSFVSPNNPGSYRSAQVVAENLGIAQLGSYIQSLGHIVQLVDARLWDLGPIAASELVKTFTPDVVGFSLISQQAVTWANAFLTDLSFASGKPIILVGGYFPTLLPEPALTLMPLVDAVVLGEGEPVLKELLLRFTQHETDWLSTAGLCSRRNGRSFRRTPRPPLTQDLDSLPAPMRYAAPFMDDQFEVLVEGSRGCASNCTFCAIRPFFGSTGRYSWRGRTPGSIIAEMLAVRKQFPRVKKFRFVDADFIGFDSEATNRTMRLADLIIEQLPGLDLYIELRVQSIVRHPHLFRRLRDAGLREVFVGVESGSQRILNNIRKAITVDDIDNAVGTLRQLGISVSFGFMMFTPWTQEADLLASLDVLHVIGSVEFDKLFHEMEVIPALRANIDETVLPVIISEQGENRDQCEEQRNIFDFSHGFACR